MQINSADLRSLMREDAIGLLLGALLTLTGMLTVVLVSVLRRRASSLIWLGLFSLIYGLRLLERTDVFRISFEVPAAVWERADAAITYVVPIPIVLFARAVFHSWRRFWTIGALGLTVFAAYAIASDAILDLPHSASTANNVIAIAFFIGVMGWIARPVQTPSRELQTLRLGASAVSVAAIADNLRGAKFVAFPGPDLEPFGFTILIACLGTIAVWRVLADAERLVEINRELDIARRIQSSILPQSMPRIPGLTIAARYRPMTAVAGDFYDFLDIDPMRIGILVADVSGHGVPAALIASMVKVALAAQRDHAANPAAVLAGMNATLCGRLAGQYVTAAYLFIDMQSRLIRYGAAGHPPMLLSTRSDGAVNEVEQNGLILGFLEKTNYMQLERPLSAGDRLLLYTDGLIEASNDGDDLFGLDRLKATLASAGGLRAEAVADSLLRTVDGWSGRPPGDDLTLVVLDWTETAGGSLLDA
jgi:sigma-B regulation protein RsbU (phosphoserine phosphatase)